jgi:RimJ/RimL family protein N-acetyltransferase
MNTYETERLTLRPYRMEDFAAVHTYSSDPENLTYMLWGPNTEADTHNFIKQVINYAEQNPIRNYDLAVVEKSSGELIGGGVLSRKGTDEGELGWIIRRDRQKLGYGTELGRFMLELAFGELKLRRLIAHCDAENYGSRRVMERIGMRREGLFLEARPAHKKSMREFSDEYSYAILRHEWHGQISYITVPEN